MKFTVEGVAKTLGALTLGLVAAFFMLIIWGLFIQGR
jgi:hypothetical protein